MTRSFTHHDADSCINDFEPRNNGATWDDFEDGELRRLQETDNATPL